MSLCHPMRHKVSFVESRNRADIEARSLDVGAENVHLQPTNDDKSSCSGDFRPGERDFASVAAALSGPPRTHAMDGPRSARCRHLLERHRPRGRKAVLAGLMAATPAPPLKRGAGRFPFGRWERAMIRFQLDNLQQYSDVLCTRRGDAVNVRFVEPRDAEELQN